MTYFLEVYCNFVFYIGVIQVLRYAIFDLYKASLYSFKGTHRFVKRILNKQ